MKGFAMKSDLPGCHACGAAPVFQWARLATEEEAAVQRENITQMQGRELSDDVIAVKYGPLRTSVTGCAEHHLGLDGSDGADRRVLLHDAACLGHGMCACGEAS